MRRVPTSLGLSHTLAMPTLRCSMSSDQNFSGTQTIQFDTVVEDNFGGFNTGTYTYTFQVKGIYVANVNFRITTTGENAEVSYLYNGTDILTADWLGGSSANEYVMAPLILFFNVNDTLLVRSTHVSTKTIDSSNATFLIKQLV